MFKFSGDLDISIFANNFPSQNGLHESFQALIAFITDQIRRKKMKA
jgi:hypothetical protein